MKIAMTVTMKTMTSAILTLMITWFAINLIVHLLVFSVEIKKVAFLQSFSRV